MLLEGAFSLLFNARIPITQLNSAISISIPFTTPFGRSASGGVGLGRSFSGETEATRLNLYREMEGYVSQITRTDGHSCLLRAMCEVSANPGHDDGLMGKEDQRGDVLTRGTIPLLPGDITNFLLTGSYSAADQSSEEGRPYLRAQAEGQVRPWGDNEPLIMSPPPALRGLLQLPLRVPGLILQILRLISRCPLFHNKRSYRNIII